MIGPRNLVLGIVAGEQSGENLAADLIDAIVRETSSRPELVGVGGERLHEHGLVSVFDPSEISITGVSAVLATLPRIMMRIHQTANAIIDAKPDAVILIDSPDFSHRVACRIKSKLPNTPIIKYVAPTVWAWRPGRAAKMAASFDHVLALFPFEPEVMGRLGGPQTHYVGHPLCADTVLKDVWNTRQKKAARADGELIEILMLPGSRRGEIRALLPDFEATVDELYKRGNAFRIHMPTLPRLESTLRRETASWRVAPIITTGLDDKLSAFRVADAALAASGTVILELALAGVPSVSLYRVDYVMKPLTSMVNIWSAALPNIITDRPLIQEFLDHMIRPGMLARQLEELSDKKSLLAKRQITGFRELRKTMSVEFSPDDRAAQIVLDVISEK